MRRSGLALPHMRKVHLKDFATFYANGFKDQRSAEQKMSRCIAELVEFRKMLAACRKQSLLIIEMGPDAAGKDGMIDRIFYPMGCRAESFKIESFWAAASQGRAKRDYLQRFEELLPESGEACVFNRSYYEHVTLDRVYPEMLAAQHITAAAHEGIWERRFEEINEFERQLAHKGFIIVKIFLNLSKREQKKRFLQRIELPEKQYKFDPKNDMGAREKWIAYRRAYEEVLSRTSTKIAPWYVIPADIKWAACAIVAKTVHDRLKTCGLHYPQLSEEQKRLFAEAKLKLIKK